MFSFHKPRVYRSTEGCCICRAKSSSSRFTDSRKYESDSMKCFNLKYARHGEICNACVLLVKRYKRLPLGSNRHWGHVVDARAGPGTKSLTRYKKYRDDNQEQNRATSSSSSVTVSGNATARNSQSSNSKSLISEKFSKIFKKTKKISKTPVNSSAVLKREPHKRKPANTTAASHAWEQHSLPTTPDSLDSDYEDNHLAAGTVVQFQTQTRASACRSRGNNTGSFGQAGSAAQGSRQRRPMKQGSKRRKCLPPRKHRRAQDQVQFFDEMEWEERKSCCGMVYECAQLGGALIVDLDYYKPCAAHQQAPQPQLTAAPTTSSTLAPTAERTLVYTPQKPLNIVATAPAVVQLTPVCAAAANVVPLPTPVVSVKPTPVLKKHHLFFKRQSECFPHGDASNYNNTIVSSSNGTVVTPLTASSSSHRTTTTMSAPACTSSSLVPAAVAVQVPLFASNTTIHSMPRHSTAKVATITPTATAIGTSMSSTITNASAGSKSHSFLNKIKADTGKIVKHSWDKLNTAVRLKPSDLQELKHVMHPVDKSYVLASASGKAQQLHASHSQQPYAHYPHAAPHPHQPLITAALSAGGSSPTSSSSSSSSSTKFSDNSSDSGFDENVLDRKSASPLQEDTERKILTRPGSGVQTMFLASGVQIQGQYQNILLTGNEVAAKVLQNRKQQQLSANGHQQHNHRISATAAATTAVKIAQIVGATSGTTSNSGSHGKIRAIYSNNNTIQHENGVTTIVPASSLAASNQTAAMHAAMAPSTVTITPAPSTHHIAKKTNIIGFAGNGSSGSSSSNNQSNIVNGNTIPNSSSSNNTSASNASLNPQKIIVLKAASKYNNNAMAVTASSTLGQLNTSVCKN